MSSGEWTIDERGSLTAGTMIGSYRLESPVGEGGMGTVYRALDTRLNRPVAIKVLSNELADADARRRFQREAQMASSLNHPHILTVHDVGEFEGRQYIVTEFVDGGTLKDWAKAEKRTWLQIVELLTGVADGLAAAHSAGILHRDIKPANILVAKNGYAKLADFGLAKLTEIPTGDATRTLTDVHTRPGMVVGTVAYMSPEQASGKPLDARSDIFSFGVVLYELVGGKRPFAGASELEVLQTIIHGTPARLAEGVPVALRLAVEKALEKDPADRYQSMRDMVVDLRRLARETPPTVRAPHWRAWGIAAALILAAGIAALWFRPGSTPAAPPRLEYTQLTNFADSAVAPSLSPDGRILAFIRGESTFEGQGDVYVKQLPNGEPVQLTHDGLIKEGPVVFSADGTRIAYTQISGGQATWTVPVLGGDPARLLANSSGLSWVDPAPGQRRVMFSAATGEGIHMGVYASTESRAEQRTVYLPASADGMAHRSFLSPDGGSVIIVEMDITGWLPCRLVSFKGSSPGKRVGPASAQCTDAAWSPDGKWMYLSVNTGDGFHIWRERFPDGLPEQVTSGATEEQGLSFAPDGLSFVTSVGSRQSTIWIHDAKGERQITSEGFAYLPSFSADGKKLYYLERLRASQRFVSGGLWVSDLATGKRERLLPDVFMEHYSISSDGQRVAYLKLDNAGHSALWIAPLDGSSSPRLLSSLDSIRVLFSPSGEVFFVAGEGGSKFLYRVNVDGSGLQKIVTDPMLFLYDISPDGKAFAAWEGKTSSVAVYSTDGSSRTFLCSGCGTAGEENRGVTPPLVQWSRDSKYLYLHTTATRETFAVPLGPGQVLPPFPNQGIRWNRDGFATLAGARALPQERAFGGIDPSVYAFPRVSTHRNIYRIPVP
jgi:eukaryotic-like serine/threonine-protein kinase